MVNQKENESIKIKHIMHHSRFDRKYVCVCVLCVWSVHTIAYFILLLKTPSFIKIHKILSARTCRFSELDNDIYFPDVAKSSLFSKLKVRKTQMNLWDWK